MKNKIIWIALCLFVISSLLAACASAAAPDSKTPAATTSSTPKTLKIGVIETMTGISSDNLKLSEQGDQLAKEYINGKGGITVNGEKYLIELSVQDNNFNPERATAAATSLVSEQKVKFIVGTIPTFMTLAISAVTEPAGVIYVPIYHAGIPPEYDPKTTKFKFYANNGTIDHADAAITAALKMWPDIKTVTASMIDDGSIPQSQGKIKAAAAKRGVTITGDIIGIPPPSVDYLPIVQKLMASNPDAVMIGNASIGMMGGQLKLLREAGYTKPVFMAGANPYDDLVAVSGKDAAVNFLTPDIDSAMIPSPTATQKDLQALALKKYPRLATVAVGGFNGVYALAQAIEKAQSLDPAMVAAAWEKLDDIDTGNGMGKMGGVEMYGIKHVVYCPVDYFAPENGVKKYFTTVNPYRP